MKNVTIEKLSSNSYRIRKQVNGHRVTIMFDHKPTQPEILKSLSDVVDTTPVKGSFYSCAQKYIASKSNVISSSTIRGYESILKNLPETFTKRKLSQITQADIQTVINEYKVDRSAKTTANAHGFIYAIIKFYRPTMIINTALPQITPNEPYTPTENDIKQILDASKGSRYHIPFQLGIMGLRLSEVCALTLDDIDVENNLLTIDKAKVKGHNNEYVIKATKTAAGTRTIYIPDKLINEIMENGKVFDGNPNTIYKNLQSYQNKLGIPNFRFHDLRHFFASYAHLQGVSDADIMASGGWKSDYTMKRVYRHEMKQKEAQKRVYDALILDNEIPDHK